MNESEITRIGQIMRTDVIRIGMDATLAEAMTVCLQHRIRHLPVVDAKEKLVGLVTDRDLRVFISHRLGTVMENNTDRETLHRRVNVMMVRRVVTATPDMTVSEAARLMLQNHVGSLPIVDAAHRLVGIVTTHDLLALLSDESVPTEIAAWRQ